MSHRRSHARLRPRMRDALDHRLIHLVVFCRKEGRTFRHQRDFDPSLGLRIKHCIRLAWNPKPSIPEGLNFSLTAGVVSIALIVCVGMPQTPPPGPRLVILHDSTPCKNRTPSCMSYSGTRTRPLSHVPMTNQHTQDN